MFGKKSEENIPSFEPSVNEQSFWEGFKSYFLETFKVVVISLAIIIPIRYYLIQPFYVKGASMEPSFHDHEYLIIDEISYRFQEPQRGDIIVFRYPRDPKQYFIKRVIATPGENIRIANGSVFVKKVGSDQEFMLEEAAYLLTGTPTAGDINLTLSPGEYFVMGDNRTASLDSRSFGPIHDSDIIGRTWVRGWPFNKIKVFHQPVYNYLAL